MFGASTDLAVQPEPKLLGQDRYSLSSDEHGRPVPYLAGRRRLGLTWISDAWGVRSAAIKRKVGKKKETVGYNYYASFAGIVCLGPVTTLHSIYVEDELVWAGDLGRNGADFTEITVEGRGALLFYWGTETQAEDGTLAASGLTHSAYRGQCYVVFDDWLLGENRSQVPTIEFDVTRLPPNSNLRSGNIALNGECHPLAVLEELLLHRRFGLGLSPALIDPASWTAVAEALADEEFSVSVLLDQAKGFDVILAEFLEFLDAALFTSPSGQIGIRLLRETTTPVTLTTVQLTEPPELTAHGWPETVNEVVVRFSNRQRGWQTDSVTFRDAASYAASGLTISQVIDCDWLTDQAVAWKVAAGLARSRSLPWLDGRLTVKRSVAGAIRPGDTVSVTYAPQGLDAVLFRVLGVELPGPESADVVLTVREDTAHLLTDDYLVPADPSTDAAQYEPAECHDVLLFELPFGFTGVTDPRILVLPARGDTVSNAFKVWWERAANSYAELAVGNVWGLRGTLNTALSKTGETYAAAALDVTISSPDNDLDDMPFAEGAGEGRFLIFLGGEILFGWSPVLTSARRYTISVLRGQKGTRKEDHGVSAEVWLVQLTGNAEPFLATFSARWGVGIQTAFKLQPLLLSREFDLTQADRLPHNFTRRALRPFGPANLTANGDGHCPTWASGEDVVLAWTLTSETRADADPTVTLASRADAAVLEIWDGGDLKGVVTTSPAGPYTLTSAALIGFLGSEKTFNVRAYLSLGGYRSTDYDSITATFV